MPLKYIYGTPLADIEPDLSQGLGSTMQVKVVRFKPPARCSEVACSGQHRIME